MLLAVGVAAIAAALLVLALVVLPAGPGRVPLNRLDPSFVPSGSAFAGAGAAAGAAVEKALAKRGRAADGAAALERAGMSMTLANFVLAVGLTTVVGGAAALLLGGPLLGLVVVAFVPFGAKVLVKVRASRRQ